MLQTLLNILAPEDCTSCGSEGTILCATCERSIVRPAYVCFLCEIATEDSYICNHCKSEAYIQNIYTASSYEGHAKNVLHAYKFLYKRSAAATCARLLAAAYPASSNAFITYVPTSAAHVRERGFDHAKLLAKEYAWITGMPLYGVLGRTTQTVQVGANRRTRTANMQQAFYAATPQRCTGKHIVLIDDVITTGATVRAAAQALHTAGAASVTVVSVARTML